MKTYISELGEISVELTKYKQTLTTTGAKAPTNLKAMKHFLKDLTLENLIEILGIELLMHTQGFANWISLEGHSEFAEAFYSEAEFFEHYKGLLFSWKMGAISTEGLSSETVEQIKKTYEKQAAKDAKEGMAYRLEMYKYYLALYASFCNLCKLDVEEKDHYIEPAEYANERLNKATTKLILKAIRFMAEAEKFDSVDITTKWPITVGSGLYAKDFYIKEMALKLAKRGLMEVRVLAKEVTFERRSGRKCTEMQEFIRLQWTELGAKVFDAELIQLLAGIQQQDGYGFWKQAADLVECYYNAFKIKKKKGVKVVTYAA